MSFFGTFFPRTEKRNPVLCFERCNNSKINNEEIMAQNETNVQNDSIDSMPNIKKTILVLSGKGGVGKSTVAVNLALELAEKGFNVGVLDVDIHGPSIPGMFGIENSRLNSDGEKMIPVQYKNNLNIISIGFLLENKKDAVIWRGPMKYSVIKQFVTDVEWGNLDYLIVDCPPGTGDEPLSVVQLLGKSASAIVVTTPQRVSIDDVRKSITFCEKLNLEVLGIVENMSGFVCPHCHEEVDIFNSGGGEKLGAEMNVPFLGKVPIDQTIVKACDEGKPFISEPEGSAVAKSFTGIVEKIIDTGDTSEQKGEVEIKKEKTLMKIAIPVAEGKLAMHFGHCEKFAFIEADEDGKIISNEELTPPAHEPGVLPAWLHEKGATHIISGGMGSRAQNLFAQNGIKVIVGAPSQTPEEIVEAYLNGSLATGDNVCDH